MKLTRLKFGKILLLTGLLLGFTAVLSAQTREISGTVSDEAGEPLIGANIVIKGTATGTVTDFDGNFKVEVEKGQNTLVISYVGYGSKEISIRNKNTLNIILSEAVDLSEVVVTALGVEREEKALGYSVQKLGAQQISAVKPNNVINALSGKASGVYVTGNSSGPTASANITIRGTASLLGNNQPLFVVNGMPITNDLYALDDGLNGSTTIDFGNAAQLLNPDDIESINILKGPAASALYGARAADGVILVETKTGRNTQGWGVNINSTTMFQGLLKLPDYQNEYGFGGGGKYSYFNGSNYIGDREYYEAYGENWGPRMNGQDIIQFNSNGQPVPFTPAPDNIRNFYRTGINSFNNFAINNGSEEGDFRFSYTRMDNTGIIPNTNLKRNTFQTSIGRRFFDDKLKVRVNAMYVNAASDNIPNSGYDESSSVQYGWLWYPRQVEIEDLRDYWETEGVQQRYVENLWVNNPWFVANENTNAFQNNRLISNFRLEYEFAPRFSVRLRYGADVLEEQRQYRRAPSTKGVELGSYREDEISFYETNAEALLSYSSDRTSGSPIQFDVKVGGNIMKQEANILIANNPELKFFGTSESIYTLTNARSGVLVESQKTQTGINSLFGLATFSLRDMIYLDFSLRNDWNSTLVNPEAGIDNSNYSFAYPSVSLSAIVSEMLQVPTTSALSFLKIKANYAEVGNGAPPYAFGTTFTPQAAFGNNSVFTTNRVVSDENLTNERTRAYEFGVDLRLFNERIRFDATYYNMLSFDQVIELPVAGTSGFDFKLTNGGEIRNKGIELMLSGTPILKDKFSWDVNLNVGHNRAIVESLPDIISGDRYAIVSNIFPNDFQTTGLDYTAIEGELLGQLVGRGFVRHPETGEIVHQNGLPMITEEDVSAGSFQPDVRLGFYNTFTFGNLSFGFLFDGQIGGKIYNRSHALYSTGGTITHNDDPNLLISALDGRQHYSVSYDSENQPVYTLADAGGGVVGPGLMWEDMDEDGEIDFDTETSPNNVAVQPGGIGYVGYFYIYYGNGFRRDNIEAATYDATYFKLRELSLSYSFPQSLLDKIGLNSLRVSLVGRNLLLFTDVPTIDPETFSVRNGVFVNGFESTQIPSTRSMGISLNIGL